jgi:carbon-monoxide dehydrogenase small subunit
MKQLIALKVNGESHEVAVEPRMTLLEVLRDMVGLTGTKNGCSLGNCGSCTVLLNGKPVASCLVLAVKAQGKEVMTIEGLAQNGELHPMQQAFIDHGALQCGFCTPGMLLSAKALLDENPSPTEDEVKEAISGNLCRCTGYTDAVNAVLDVAERMKEAK